MSAVADLVHNRKATRHPQLTPASYRDSTLPGTYPGPRIARSSPASSSASPSTTRRTGSVCCGPRRAGIATWSRSSAMPPWSPLANGLPHRGVGQRPHHGQQFKSRFIRSSAPSSVEGIEKYLGSGMIRGIGPVYARKLVRAFGDKVFDVIEAEPERLPGGDRHRPGPRQACHRRLRELLVCCSARKCGPSESTISTGSGADQRRNVRSGLRSAGQEHLRLCYDAYLIGVAVLGLGFLMDSGSLTRGGHPPRTG